MKVNQAYAQKSWPSLERRLKNNGFPSRFIRELLRYYDDSRRDQVIKLNVMGFLMSPDYSGHVSDDGTKRCRNFLLANQKAFSLAERRFGVKREIIASLLWVESRLGENHGQYHVASVFLNLLQAEAADVQSLLMQDLQNRVSRPTGEMKKKVKDRSRTKSRWAIGELWALYKMYRRSPKLLGTLKGSYSGAFGYSQFLPSSYIAWAKSMSVKTPPDLYQPGDAIISVANYLKQNGYRRGQVATYKKALFHYNRSVDYGTTILTLSSNLSAQ